MAIVAMVSGCQQGDIPDHYATVNDDSLMRLMITKGFAKEKEDNID